MLWRLLGSPSGEPEQIKELYAEMVSSLEDCLGQKGGKPSWTMGEPDPIDIQPLRSKTPRRGNRDTSAERRLAEAREAQQRALATTATLEEEIELSQPITRGQSEAHDHSRSWDHQRWRSRGWKRRFCQVWLEESHAPYFEYHPPWRGPESEKNKEDPMDLDLEALPESGMEVDHFLQGPAKSLEEEDKRTSSPESQVEELESWMTWRAQIHDMPGWWEEMAKVPGVDDHKKLAQEVWASFHLPQWISEQYWVENYHQAPLAPPCLHWKSFLPPPNSKFACQDIRELQWEKMVAYAKDLQFWVEKANLPTQGQPCLLAGSIVELREEMKWYVYYTDEDVFSGMALPEESPVTQPKEPTPGSAQLIQADSPAKEAIVEVTKGPTRERKPPNWFPGWEKVLHPSRPVAAAGQVPSLLGSPMQRPCSQSSGERMAQ